MNGFKFLQPIDQMERISRTALGEHLDEIMAKIDKENIGYVITDEGKNDLVLCPAHWLSFMFDDDFGCIVNSALRYAIGRHTYMPSVVMDFVRRYLDVLDTKTISVMIEDIERELSDEQLDCREDWRKLRDDLQAHYQKMLQTKANEATPEKWTNG